MWVAGGGVGRLLWQVGASWGGEVKHGDSWGPWRYVGFCVKVDR